MNSEMFLTFCGTCVVAAPVVLLAVLGGAALFGRPLHERTITNCTQASILTGLVAALAVLANMLLSDSRYVPLELGNLVVIPGEHFHFVLKFVFDRLSVPFVILTYILVGTIGAFGSRYLHRDAGFRRFFLLYAFFLLGMVLATLAGTIETLFLGWELVGLSSALLVAYFHERRSPVANGQRIWSVYRLADAAFLLAAVALHHLHGSGDFDALMGSGPWPYGQATLSPNSALIVGSLLLIAAAGKSALVPFSGWLPRAMEGPTPSSAVFYGALSVHLGTFLLLRVSPLLELSPWLSGAVVVVGLATALFAALGSHVQSDVKSGLAFASLTQVGIITVEIGLGFRYLALVHIIGHACLRTLQLLRAPSQLRDYRQLENAIGTHLTEHSKQNILSKHPNLALRLYRFAYRRGSLDAALDRWIVRPFLAVFAWSNRMEQRWTQLLSGETEAQIVPAGTRSGDHEQ
jgi:NADH:ubiquinone oxidoreductase subunit 5 (subunit L)/multisubunit Na+/H+ antiporter MnhA subunit